MGQGERNASAFVTRPWVRVLAAQAAAFVLVLAVPWGARQVFGQTPPVWLYPVIQSALASALGAALGLRRWWLALNLALPPMAWLGQVADVPAWVYLAGFAALYLVFTNASRELVPLYLTNRATWAELARILDEETPPPGRRPAFVDLGCGLGGMLEYLARAHPDWDFMGVETAPGPYLVARIRLLFVPNAEVRFQSLWETELSAFDVVYAFLSPAPMARLHAKASAEMQPGSLFVSNSFWAPGVAFDGERLVEDDRKTRLIIKRL